MNHIVYYAYLGDNSEDELILSERLAYIDKQLFWLRSCLDRSVDIFSVTVVATCPDSFREKLLSIVSIYSFEAFPVFNSVNTYEYHGFYCLMDIARNLSDNEFIFYCHSKGVVNRSSSAESIFKIHTHFLLQDKVLFEVPSGIKKIGLFPSQYGWMWHNFFWITAAQLLSKKLLISEKRHYYESFIGNFSNESAFVDCLGYRPHDFDVIGFSDKNYYTPSDLNIGLPLLYKHFSEYRSSSEVIKL
jgi:hypothetical protein